MDHSAHNHLIHMLSELNPIDLVGFASIFSFSFLSSLHCAFMCAPLVCSFMGDRAKLNQTGIWLYNAGRLISYAGAGWILGALGEKTLEGVPAFGKGLALCLGVLLMVIALLKAGKLLGLWSFDIDTPQLKLTGVASAIKKLPHGLREFGFGFMTVLLPCMTLTPVLALAATSAHALKGSLLLLAFALGTVPVMLGATYVPLIIYRKVSPKLVHWLVVVFLLVSGIITVIR